MLITTKPQNQKWVLIASCKSQQQNLACVITGLFPYKPMLGPTVLNPDITEVESLESL